MPQKEFKIGTLTGFGVGRYNNWEVDPNNNEWVLPKQPIGVEIEIEGVTPEAVNKFGEYQGKSYNWDPKQDGSLRNNGIEFITRHQGLGGQRLSLALEQFFSFAQDKKKYWKPSERTGIHIHLDVRDLDLYTSFRKLLITYMIFEKPIFEFIGGDRRNNIFCLPMYKAQADLDNIGRLFLKAAANNEVTWQTLCKEFNRYSALNLQALASFGTFEFRHLQTTLERTKIVDWINIIQSLKKFALKCPLTYLELINFASNDINGLAHSIFKNSLLSQMIPGFDVEQRNRFLKQMCATGIEIAKDTFILYAPPDVERRKENNEDRVVDAWEDGEVVRKRTKGLINKFFDKNPNLKE